MILPSNLRCFLFLATIRIAEPVNFIYYQEQTCPKYYSAIWMTAFPNNYCKETLTAAAHAYMPTRNIVLSSKLILED